MNIHIVANSSLFLIGLWGIFINSQNLLKIILSFQILILAVINNFIYFAYSYQNFDGQMFALFFIIFAFLELIVIFFITIIISRQKHSLT